MTRCTLALLGLWLVIPGVRAEPPAIAVKAEAVLRKNCASCHGPGGKSKGGFGYVLDRERLIARQKVVPGKPAESELFERVRLGEMPPKEATLYVAPGAAGVAILKEWIEAGAAELADCRSAYFHRRRCAHWLRNDSKQFWK